MKIIVFLLTIGSPFTIFAREQAIPDSISPDKKYRITVEESHSQIYYHIVDLPGHHLLSIPSSYKTEDGSGDFAWKQSLEPTINWRKDSTAVAIDEQNRGTMGTVLIAQKAHSEFEHSEIPATSSLMKLTGKHWDRGRLFFFGWNGITSINLGLLGRVSDSNNGYKEDGTEFTISLKDGKVMSIDGKAAQADSVTTKPSLPALHVGMASKDVVQEMQGGWIFFGETLFRASNRRYTYIHIPDATTATLQFDEHYRLVSWKYN